MFRTKQSLVRASTILLSARKSARLPEMPKKITPEQTEAPQKGLRHLYNSIQ